MSIQITVTLVILLISHNPIISGLVTNCNNILTSGQTKDCPSHSEYRCVDTSYDHVREYCFCNVGLKYVYNLNACFDINECDVEQIEELCREDSPTPNEVGHCGPFDACTLSEFNCAKASEPICHRKLCKNLNGGHDCYCPENSTLIKFGSECACKEGFQLGSDSCYRNVCLDGDKCQSGGVCEYREPPEMFHCNCEPNYSGRECEYKVCQKVKEMYFGFVVEWEEDKVGEVSQIRCESIHPTFVGIATRECALNSVWLNSDYSQCVREIFSNLKEQLLAMEEETDIVILQNNIRSVVAERNSSNNSMLYPPEIAIMDKALDTLVIEFVDIQQNPNAYSEVTNNATKETPEVVVSTGSFMLNEDNRESWEITSLADYSGNRTNLASLVDKLEKFSDSMNISSTSENISISDENLMFNYNKIKETSSVVLFPQWLSEEMTFRNVRVNESLLQLIVQSCGSITFRSFVFPTIRSLTPLVELYNPSLAMKENASINSIGIETAYLITDVLSLNTKACKEFEITPEAIEIEFIIESFQSSNNTLSKPVCAYWNLTRNSWSMEGVTTKEEQLSNGSVQIICILSHLTSFAILLSSHEPVGTNNTIQIVLSAVVVSVSIMCILASLVCYLILYLRTRKSSKNPFKKDSIFIIHINFCIALLLGFLTFIASQVAVGSDRIPCTILAAILHYLLLSVFSWSLCEGIAIAWKIRFWDKRQTTWPYLIPLGWGFPIPVVLTTVPLTHWYYVDPEVACWVSNTNHLKVLSFILPMVMLMPTNLLFYIYTLVTIYRVKERLESAQRARELIIGSLVLLPLLGLPWIIGVFYVSEATAIFGYIFIILIGSQGTFFFIAHVVRNQSIREYVFKWKNPYEAHAKFQKLHSSFKTDKTSATPKTDQDDEIP